MTRERFARSIRNLLYATPRECSLTYDPINNLTTAYMDLQPEEKQEILETIDISARMEKVSRMLAHRIEFLRLSQEIGCLGAGAAGALCLATTVSIASPGFLGRSGRGSTAHTIRLAPAKARMPHS